MICVDYKEFLRKRFDLVIRYHLLDEAGFNIADARELALSRKYGFLAEASGEIIKKDMFAFPVVDKKMKSALRTYGFSIGKTVIFYLFSPRKYKWLEKTISEDPEWMKECPHLVDEYAQGASNKRFLLALKYDHPLYWAIERRKIPRPCRAIWKKEEYEGRLSKEQFEIFLRTKQKMIDHMKKLLFFSRGHQVL